MPAEQLDSARGGEENGGRQDGRGDSARQPRPLGGNHHRQRRCQVKQTNDGKTCGCVARRCQWDQWRYVTGTIAYYRGTVYGPSFLQGYLLLEAPYFNTCTKPKTDF